MKLKKDFFVVVALIILSIWIANLIKPFCEERYGINTLVVFLLFMIAEIIFDITLVLMAIASGIANFTLQLLLQRKKLYQDLKWDRPIVKFAWIVNRASWVMPFLYLLYSGWSSLPIIILLGITLEIVITMYIGVKLMMHFTTFRTRQI